MKKCLLNEEQKTLKSNNKIVKFDYEHYIDACKVMAEEIKKNYNLDEDNIELIGMARGGLPMLVTLSHLLGVRKVSMIQTQMSNSDNCHDYGKFRYMSDNIDNSNLKIILRTNRGKIKMKFKNFNNLNIDSQTFFKDLKNY